jgi:hypothetical protein
MFADERETNHRYRWTNGHGAVRLAVDRPGRYRLVMQVRAYRPANLPPAELVIAVDGRVVERRLVSRQWEEITVEVVLLQPAPLIELTSTTFVVGYADSRTLGIAVDWLELRPLPTGPPAPASRP